MDIGVEARLAAIANAAHISEEVLLGIVREIEQAKLAEVCEWLEDMADLVPDGEYALIWAARELRRKAVD